MYMFFFFQHECVNFFFILPSLPLLLVERTGKDILDGGDGTDTLDGGNGADVLYACDSDSTDEDLGDIVYTDC